MRHSGNVGTVIDASWGDQGVTLKVYVHDELGRFVTVATLSHTVNELEAYRDGVFRRRDELEQMALWDDDEAQSSNVRWLPPKP